MSVTEVKPPCESETALAVAPLPGAFDERDVAIGETAGMIKGAATVVAALTFALAGGLLCFVMGGRW